MFFCYRHNWSHIGLQCPLCHQEIVTTTGSANEPLELGEPDTIEWRFVEKEKYEALLAHALKLEAALETIGDTDFDGTYLDRLTKAQSALEDWRKFRGEDSKTYGMKEDEA